MANILPLPIFPECDLKLERVAHAKAITQDHPELVQVIFKYLSDFGATV
jgi:hypothetical protein